MRRRRDRAVTPEPEDEDLLRRSLDLRWRVFIETRALQQNVQRLRNLMEGYRPR